MSGAGNRGSYHCSKTLGKTVSGLTVQGNIPGTAMTDAQYYL